MLLDLSSVSKAVIISSKQDFIYICRWDNHCQWRKLYTVEFSQRSFCMPLVWNTNGTFIQKMYTYMMQRH